MLKPKAQLVLPFLPIYGVHPRPKQKTSASCSPHPPLTPADPLLTPDGFGPPAMSVLMATRLQALLWPVSL